MTHGQTTEERVAALRSVLPLLLPRNLPASQLRNWSESLPGPNDGPPPPPPPPPCSWRCWRCMRAASCSVDEPWHREWIKNCKAYKVDQIYAALQVLQDLNLFWYQSVWHTYVNPWPEYAPERREEWALEGLRFLSAEVPGKLYAYVAPVEKPKEPRDTEARNAKIRELADEPYLWGQKRIAKFTGASETTVSAVLRGLKVRRGRILSADSLTKADTPL